MYKLPTMGDDCQAIPLKVQENCKVLTQGGQVHVFGHAFLGKLSFLAEKWTSPRTLQFSWLKVGGGQLVCYDAASDFLALKPAFPVVGCGEVASP
jgi:hypothetical protein